MAIHSPMHGLSSRTHVAQRLRSRGSSETTILVALAAAGLLAVPIALALQAAPEANEGALEGPNGTHVITTVTSISSEGGVLIANTAAQLASELGKVKKID